MFQKQEKPRLLDALVRNAGEYIFYENLLQLSIVCLFYMPYLTFMSRSIKVNVELGVSLV